MFLTSMMGKIAELIAGKASRFGAYLIHIAAQ
jgi:hypothetical protein